MGSATPGVSPDSSIGRCSTKTWLTVLLPSGRLIDPPVQNFAPPGSHRWLDACAGVCQDFKYMGLQWVDQCWCSNEYGHHGSAAGCGATGSMCGRGYRNAPAAHTSQCGNVNAVYRTRRNP